MARANRVRELWQAGKPVINGWLGIPSAFRPRSWPITAGIRWSSICSTA